MVLARSHGAMPDWEVQGSGDWTEVRAEYGAALCFQQVQDCTPPSWPSQSQPPQMHLDVMVDDLDTAEAALLELGATRAEHQPGETFRVLLDPAGHPFCLCTS